MTQQNEIAKLESSQNGAILKYQIVQAFSYCGPFMLVDLGVKPLICGVITIICCAILPPLTMILLKKPWKETIMIGVSSTFFGAFFAAMMCAMLRPDQFIYGGMLKHHIPVTLPIILFEMVAVGIPALVQLLWDFNARPKPLTTSYEFLEDKQQ
ncbi:MAG: hypothetical protein EKK48_27245 [Candidatus Melainabacteria bacterium]|nr:MAG: hypothetical protein EKK48_27245 [Candidatus Melainabacteria bacterium]